MSLVLNADTGASMIQNGTVTSAKIVDGSVLYADMVGTDIPMIGVGQTWQDVTASRVAGTTYTNTTGKPIFVSYRTSGSIPTVTLIVNGATVAAFTDSAGTNMWIGGIVPIGATYSVTCSDTTAHVWFELR